MNWDLIKKNYDELLQKLTSPDLESRERSRLQKLLGYYTAVLEKHKEEVTLVASIEELKKEIAEVGDDGELSKLYEEEISQKDGELKKLRLEVEDLLYPSDGRDNASVFVEIRAGAGGQEAALFVSDLFKMYSNYSLARHWTVSVMDSSPTDIGGYKEIVLYIKGKNVYKHLKFESGVHRVQRVPKTEASGRIHTSTVTVAVLPEVAEVEVKIDPKDIRVDVYRSSGPGGQSVNTTDSAVRITHVPTGIVVSCQDERSQIKNKAKAMKVLQARIAEAEKRKKEAEISAERKSQIGSGERSEKIRTYNYPQNRVTDHRINLTLKKLDVIMEGVLDDLINPLVSWSREQRKKESLIFLQK